MARSRDGAKGGGVPEKKYKLRKEKSKGREREAAHSPLLKVLEVSLEAALPLSYYLTS